MPALTVVWGVGAVSRLRTAALPCCMCIDAFALFRWQVALVDAMAFPDDPHRGFEQLFVSCAASAGSAPRARSESMLCYVLFV